MTNLPDFTKLNLAQVKQALHNGGYGNSEDITHTAFANRVDKGLFRYIIIYASAEHAGCEQGSVYISLGDDGKVRGDF